MSPVFFNNPAEFRAWLEENHEKGKELWVGFYKKETGKPSMTWPESVDQALCFGWIDGIRKKIDEESYCNRFTPRKPGSTWSRINIAKVEDLMRKGLMRPDGIKAFEKRKENNSGIYSFENEIRDLPEEYAAIFKENEAAWAFYSATPPSYRKTMTHWVLSAKQETTRMSRLNKLITESEKQKRIFG